MQLKEVKKMILAKQKKELPKHLSYHSIDHIKDVYNSSKRIGNAENISSEDMTLLLTAALFHDSGFIERAKEHEKLSCKIARQYLPQYNYNPIQIDKICGMIMATKLPQTPLNILEEIICDADLDYLGRDDFFTIGDRLFTELSMYGIINNENDWNKLQISFLEKHHYFTKTAILLRQSKKDEHLHLLKQKIQ